jgi:hypothetical protein
MASEIDICNAAFLALGHTPITSLEEGSNKSIIAKALYPIERDAALRAYPWNFARTRATIAADATPPISGEWSRQFTMPSSPYCLRVVRIDDNPEIEYKIEGRKILCEESTLNLLYIARIEDVALFDSLFLSTLSYRMAAKMAYAITGSNTVADAMWKLYLGFVREAKSIDGQEAWLEELRSNDLTDVR